MPNILKIAWVDGKKIFKHESKGRCSPLSRKAETIPHLKFDNVRKRSLKWIWENSEAFNLYRGTDWMPDPCKSCDRKEIDWGVVDVKAMALTGDAKNTDPACSISPLHSEIFQWQPRKLNELHQNLFTDDME